MKRDISVIAVLVLIILAGAILFRSYAVTPQNNDGEPSLPISGLGQRLGESKTFGNVVVTPISVIEDSRCAEGTQCVWAGTVKVRTQIKSGLGTAFENIEINKPITTEAEEVTLVSVTPYPRAGQTISTEDYRFEYSVKLRSSSDVDPPVLGKCYVGGCSAQICSDQEGVASNCEFRAEYACYRTAKCERQSNGQCGWTQTNELKMCLQNPPAI